MADRPFGGSGTALRSYRGRMAEPETPKSSAPSGRASARRSRRRREGESEAKGKAGRARADALKKEQRNVKREAGQGSAAQCRRGEAHDKKMREYSAEAAER